MKDLEAELAFWQPWLGRTTSVEKMKDHSSKTFYDHVEDVSKKLPCAAMTTLICRRSSHAPSARYLAGAEGRLRRGDPQVARVQAGAREARGVGRGGDREAPHRERLHRRALFAAAARRRHVQARLRPDRAVDQVGAHQGRQEKERQKLRSGSKQNAPTIFGLAGINAADARAEEESGLKLKDHADRAGADICGKENALDHAMLQSIERTSRSGGMATKGTKEEPHLMCMTGDGAGSTDAKSSVRVGHFPGTTKLGGATRGPAGTSRASAGSREKRRPL